MQLGMRLHIEDLDQVASLAREAEDNGIDALWSQEVKRDAFLPLLLAAEHTKRVQIGTGIALAFPRSPMVTAYLSWDLQAFSHGRFTLGLGSQVKGHIERRFGMPWDPPAPKMRELVKALRAIWDCWQNGTPLNFTGKYYRFTLMTPHFALSPLPYRRIPVLVAGVNPTMCRVAGEVADGLMVHFLHSPAYIRDVISPSVRQGAQSAGRDPKDIPIYVSILVATGESQRKMQERMQAIRQQLAFYCSTRTYAPVLATHGWEDVVPQLHQMSLQGDWEGMGRRLTDTMLKEFAVVGAFDEVPYLLKERYAGIADHIIPEPYIDERDEKRRFWTAVAAAAHR